MTESTSGVILEERDVKTAEILSKKDVKNLIENVNTTQWSLIHSLFPVRNIQATRGLFYCHGREWLGVPCCYLLLVITAILPLLVLIISAGLAHTLFSHPQTVQVEPKLPFILDMNSIFTFLVSYPIIINLLARDDKILADALKRLAEQGILRFDHNQHRKINGLLDNWKLNYTIINLLGQLAGIIVGLIVAYANYRIYTQKEFSFWIVTVTDPSRSLNAAGYVYLISIGLLYFFLTIYIVRILAHSAFLANLVNEKNSQLCILFLHPDRCGGLSPVGEIGLQNQIPISVFGVNIVLLILVSRQFFHIEYPLLDLILAAATTYFILGPLAFFAPLMAFRTAMRKKKDMILESIARGSRKLEGIERELEQGLVTEHDKDEKIIEELRKIGDQVLGLPVWPFDISTVTKFGASYFIPFISGILSGVIQHYLSK